MGCALVTGSRRPAVSEPELQSGASRPRPTSTLSTEDVLVDTPRAGHGADAGFWSSHSTECFFAHYGLREVIGVGSYAKVYAAYTACGSTAAVKVLCFPVGCNEVVAQRASLMATAAREREVWHRLGKHNHIISLFHSFFSDRACYFVMERCPRNLQEHLRKHPHLDESTLAGVFEQMLQATAHVHGCGVVHRDIKPDNFLVDKESGLKMSDFGLSVMCSHKNGDLTDLAGTPPFMSPEMLLKSGYGQATDIWSLGVLAYVLLCGEFPYMPSRLTPRLMKAAICSGDRLPSFCPGRDSSFSNSAGDYIGPSDLCTEFLQVLLDRNPRTRMSAFDALQMEFLTCENALSPLPSLRPMLFRAIQCGAFAPVQTSSQDVLKSGSRIAAFDDQTR